MKVLFAVDVEHGVVENLDRPVPSSMFMNRCILPQNLALTQVGVHCGLESGNHEAAFGACVPDGE